MDDSQKLIDIIDKFVSMLDDIIKAKVDYTSGHAVWNEQRIKVDGILRNGRHIHFEAWTDNNYNPDYHFAGAVLNDESIRISDPSDEVYEAFERMLEQVIDKINDTGGVYENWVTDSINKNSFTAWWDESLFEEATKFFSKLEEMGFEYEEYDIYKKYVNSMEEARRLIETIKKIAPKRVYDELIDSIAIDTEEDEEGEERLVVKVYTAWSREY